MPTHDPDIILESLRTDGARLCFYPSCGNRSPWVVAGLDADVFVFSDKLPRNAPQRKRFWQSFEQGFVRHGLRLVLEFATVRTRCFRLQDKFLFLFFQDNNQALGRIHEAGWKISTFVGICDGCCEGGNYECVHDDPFLSKVLATAADGMEYITDHSMLLASGHGMNLRFRHHVTHPSGWEFTLHSLLFKQEQEGQERYQILLLPEGQRIPAASSDLSLARLVPMRQRYWCRMIANYSVKKISSDATRLQPAPNAERAAPEKLTGTTKAKSTKPRPGKLQQTILQRDKAENELILSTTNPSLGIMKDNLLTHPQFPMPQSSTPIKPKNKLSCDFIRFIRERSRAVVDLENADDWLEGALTASGGAGNPDGSSLKLSNKADTRIDAALRLLIESLKDQPVSGQTTFDQVFFEAVQQVARAANPDCETSLFTFGRAQKVVNIVLKYCYAWWFCKHSNSPRYGDLSWVERWAAYFHMPVDRITLEHLNKIPEYKHLTISGTMHISWKWHLSMSRYCAIQDAVRHLASAGGYMDGLHYEMDRIWVADENSTHES